VCFTVAKFNKYIAESMVDLLPGMEYEGTDTGKSRLTLNVVGLAVIVLEVVILTAIVLEVVVLKVVVLTVVVLIVVLKLVVLL